MADIDKLVEELESLSLRNKDVPRVCYVYDEEMTKHAGDKHHPENPDRIRTINDHLVRSGLLNEALILPSRIASVDEISLAHSRELVEKVLSFTSESGLIGGPQPSEDDVLVKQKQYMFPFDHDTYVCHSTPLAAQLACGSVLNVIDAICSNRCQRGFAAIRPPGHHACYDKSMGFCLFNNVAVAAEYAKRKFGLSRVAIIDWDVHHGNGTSNIFHSREDILVLSIHRYDRGKYYPGTGHLNDIGEGSGKGFNINVPIDGSYGDEEILYVWDRVVLPSISEFKPDLVLVSAGFDAAENDPLGQCHVRCKTYGVLVEKLLNHPDFGGKLALVLEGGYNLNSIAAASVACMKALTETQTQTGLSSPTSSSSVSDASSVVSSVRSVPGAVPKTSVVRMVHALTSLLHETTGFKIPIAPDDIRRNSRSVQKIPENEEKMFLLTSGGGHRDGLVRYSDTLVEKRTTVREALCYWLIADALGSSIDTEILNSKVDWFSLVSAEKKRIGFADRVESFKRLGDLTCTCTKIIIRSDTEASVVLEDLTAGLLRDENLGVLDIKLGTHYHTPEDGPDRVVTRRQKAALTSASTLGMRLTACRCLDGFFVSKHKAHKMKLMEQMVPVVRRFMYSSVENFESSMELASSFSAQLLDMFETKTIDVKFIASSALFVIGKRESDQIVEVRCKLVDLAHLFETTASDVAQDGFVLGCRNLKILFQNAREPSYESA
jgi:acetoin utilization deacetylase AcuC-like enzyme